MTISEAASWLMAHDDYLIITHRRPDGDTLGSAAALVRGLRACGKTAYIFKNEETTSKYLGFVSPFLAPDGFEFRSIVSVDVASEGLFPKGSEHLLGRTDLAIDHHPSNTLYAALTCVDGSKAACGEMIYDLLIELNGDIDDDTAAALYTAISTDTGCFAFGNTTHNTFRCAALVTETNIGLPELNRVLFRTKSRGRLELEGTVMAGIRYYYGGRVSITSITKALMDRTGCTEDDMDDIAAIPGAVEGVWCGITMRELSSETDVKISVRSGNLFNSNEFCSKFGGGGHAMASGASFKGITLETLLGMLLEELDKIFLPQGYSR